jgi:hypothetical protein
MITEKQIDELDNFFKKAALPATVQLDEGSKILNVRSFIDSHLLVIRSNREKPIYEVFYTRVIRLKGIIKT